MIKKALFVFSSATLLFAGATLLIALAASQVTGIPPSLALTGASATILPELELVVFEQTVEADAGQTIPTATGKLDGAGVIGYVFPTTMSPSVAGFGNTDGILAIAVTAHPDFDDTPFFDENQDGDYANDGSEWHSHWVVLIGDDRVAGGLSVKQFSADEQDVVMPPTNPGLPLYLDSPGYPVVVQGNAVKVLVPNVDLDRGTDFAFDAATTYLQVNTSDESLPLLGVTEIYSVLSGDLSLPFTVE